MPLPEHVTPEVGSRQGKAPYNFVPLPEAVFQPAGEPFKAHDRLDGNRLHGFIDLEITTETELYTRCAYPPAEEDKEVRRSRPRQEFYHHGNENRPVIPGSSLRGMVRALVEILAYSRITRRGDALRIRDERLVYRAVADQQTPTGRAYNQRFLRRRGEMQFDYPSSQIQAGYLEPGSTTSGWQIRPALKKSGISFVRVNLNDLSRNSFPVLQEDLKEFFIRKKGTWETLTVPGFPGLNNGVLPVWIQPAPIQRYPHARGLALYYARTNDIANAARSGMVCGKLVYSGPMGTRHMHTVIYEPDMKANPIQISEAMWEQFREDRDQQRGIPCRKIYKAGDPLFYLLDNSNKLEFFGPTLFFRLPYPNYTGDYVPQATVDADGSLDLAEAIFGTVNGEPQEGKPHTGPHKGRVQFEDAELTATPEGGSVFLDGNDGVRWPAILSTPKPTSYQNYLVQSDPQGKRENLLSYSAPPPDAAGREAATALRGFKLYWHRESAAGDLHLPPLPENSTQYTVIRPIKPGVGFQGRVRFENLTPLELGALLAALELPADYRHHLGMGKPLGMGSVRIRATPTLIDPVQHYQSLASRGQLEQAEQDHKLAEARKAFRSAIVQHHNGSATSESRVPAEAVIWDIPRLQTLGLMLDWEHKPPRARTDYIRELQLFRSRQVLPTPAGVRGLPEPRPPRPAQPPNRPRNPAQFPLELDTLQAILKDSSRTQREKLEAIDETLLTQLAVLDEGARKQAWELIRWTIGVNKRTRERLQAIQQRLQRD